MSDKGGDGAAVASKRGGDVDDAAAPAAKRRRARDGSSRNAAVGEGTTGSRLPRRGGGAGSGAGSGLDGTADSGTNAAVVDLTSSGDEASAAGAGGGPAGAAVALRHADDSGAGGAAAGSGAGADDDLEASLALARQLQAEEDAAAGVGSEVAVGGAGDGVLPATPGGARDGVGESDEEMARRLQAELNGEAYPQTVGSGLGMDDAAAQAALRLLSGGGLEDILAGNAMAGLQDMLAGGAGRVQRRAKVAERSFDGRKVFANRARMANNPEDAVAFEELLSPAERLTNVILTAMEVDGAWLSHMLARVPKDAQVSITCHAPAPPQVPRGTSMSDDQKKTYKMQVEAEADRIRGELAHLGFTDLAVRPWCAGYYSTFHAKLVICRWNTGRVRVAVNSGNLTAEQSEWRQTMWAQDFREAATDEGSDERREVGAFERQLRLLLSWCYREAETLCSGKPPAWMSFKPVVDAERYAFLDRVDLSAANAELVVSLPGRFEGDRRDECGQARLAAAVRACGPWSPDDSSSTVLITCSSVGRLTREWLATFAKSVGHADAKAVVSFPSRDTVATIGGAGFIFCQENFWKSEKFPRDAFRDVVPLPSTALPTHSSGGVAYFYSHAKIVLRVSGEVARLARGGAGATEKSDGASWGPGRRLGAAAGDSGAAGSGGAGATTQSSEVSQGRPLVAWLYAGSHNLSASAWGAYYKGGSQLAGRSVEAGVVVATRDAAEASQWLQQLPSDLLAASAQPQPPRYVPYSAR